MSGLQPGAVFGRDFQIVKSLRQGGMGAVYIALQLSTGKQRALKVMAPELVHDAPTRERFVLEARAASRIESDHVVEIVTAGVDEETGAPFLVMELLKGEELADASARLGPLPLGDVAEILSQVGHALEQAHMQGIVHRDLKPENIFLASSRRRDVAFTAKVLDFGIAKLVADSQKTGTQPLGTPLFMSPEQTDRKGRICPATDVWALGLIAFRLLAGRDYWAEAEGGSLPQLLREICMEPLPFASVRVAELNQRPLEQGQVPVPPMPAGFDAWFARCVHRDVDARFQDAGQAVRAFSELVTESAPRGKLVMQPQATGQIDIGNMATGPIDMAMMTGMPRSVQVTPVGGATGSSMAATGMVATGAAMAQTAPPKSGGASPAVIGVVALVLGAGAFGAYKAFGGAGDKPGPAAMSSASAAPTGSATAAPVVAAKPGTCPEGMATIPAGKMFMGARDLNPDTKPPHEVTLASYCLDKTEVTTEAYQACVATGECERALDKVSWPSIKADQITRFSPFCNAGHADRAKHPINCVAWQMADTFCKKHGARLPTEAEWEYAARGSVQRKYPWGDDPPGPKFLNACGKECSKWGDANSDKRQMMYDEDDGFPGTAPVGSFPAGASSFGIQDLAGNVWEWTADWYGPYGEASVQNPKGAVTGTQRVARGGDFLGSMADWARPAYRWKTDPDTFNHAIGFRCAADPK